MNKTELVKAIAKSADVSEAVAKRTLDATLTTITKSLKKRNDVRITGFGSFTVRKRAARKGRNPHTGETIKIKASKAPAFRAGQVLKAAVR